MTPTRKNPARGGLRGFLILTIIVVLSGALLWSQGDLISPVQSTNMLLSLSSGEAGFAMAGEGRQMPPASASTTTTADTTVAVTTTTTTSTGSMTLDEFTAALSAAGVDVEAVAATMSAEGRSLDNLLAVVNSGRTTVAELATRLQASASGQTTSVSTTTTTSSTVGQPPIGERDESNGLLNFQWNALGSVAYNLWFILVTTILVILAGRPVGWLVNRMNNRTTRTSAA
jgi:hypothetical protein